MKEWMLIILAYGVGSIPIGFLLAKYVAGVDVRQYGSGNIGATNITRVLGKKLGVVTLVLDVLKGFIVVYAAEFLNFSAVYVSFVAAAVLIGNCFSIFLKGRGGKGVATSLGICLALDLLYFCAATSIYFLFFLWSRISAVGSLMAAIGVTVFGGVRADPYFPLFLFMMALMLIRHSANIRDLYSKICKMRNF